MMWSIMSCWLVLIVVVGRSFDKLRGVSSASERLLIDWARHFAEDRLKKPEDDDDIEGGVPTEGATDVGAVANDKAVPAEGDAETLD